MSGITKAFGTDPAGNEVALYELVNQGGMKVQISQLGATIVSIQVKDQKGVMTDVVLGYDDASGYLTHDGYLGAIIGRSGNRIDKGRFVINGKTYQLDINDKENNLHSGNYGFDRRLWTLEAQSDNSVTLSLVDADMEQGYPGNFKVTVTYTVTEENELWIHYQGCSDQDTVANMTNHVYFNLNGQGNGSILDHEVWMNADRYTPVRDSQAIPTGELAPVAGTPMDFTQTRVIGDDIDADFDQLQMCGGYDHNFVIRDEKGEVTTIARVKGPKSGIVMEVLTDLPGVQFYCGNFLDPDRTGKGGAIYSKRNGFCMETQYFPNSINQEGFASPLLKAGEKYDTKTCYRFTV